MTTESMSPPLTSAAGTSSGGTEDVVETLKPKKPVLENLPQRQRLTGHQAEARSRMIRRLRIILPVLAVLLIGVFFLTSRNAQEDDAFLEDLALDTVTAEEALVLQPTFSGLDNDGQPYEITAESAVQSQNQDNLVKLTDPTAIMRDNGADTKATAKKGEFQSDTNLLELNEDVTLQRDINGKPYILQTSEATVSIKDETVTTGAGVTGRSENGRLRADSMQVFNGERRVILKGNVLMKFEPKTLKDASDAINETEKEDKTPER